MFCRQLINEIMQCNLEKSGYQKGFGNDVTQQIILPGTTPEFLLGKEKGDKNEEQVILFRIMHEKRKSYNCLSLHFYQRRNLFNYDDTAQFSTEYIRTCSLTREGICLVQHTQFLGRTNWSKNSAMQPYCFLLGKLPLSPANTLQVRAAQSCLPQGLQLPLRLCSVFSYYLGYSRNSTFYWILEDWHTLIIFLFL